MDEMPLGPKLRLNKHIIERCLRYHEPDKVVTHFVRMGYSRPACILMIHRVQADLEKRQLKAQQKILRAKSHELLPSS